MSFTIRMAVREYRQYSGKEAALREVVDYATPTIKYYLRFYRKFFASWDEGFSFGVQKIIDFLDHDYDMNDRDCPLFVFRRYIHNAYEHEAKKIRNNDILMGIPETMADPRIEDAAEHLIKMEDLNRLYQALDTLSTFEREIIHLRYEEKKTYREIGEKIHRSFSRVRYIIKDILKKLKDYIVKHEAVDQRTFMF